MQVAVARSWSGGGGEQLGTDGILVGRQVRVNKKTTVTYGRVLIVGSFSMVRGGHVAVVEWLVSADGGGVSLRERDRNQNSAVLIAASLGRVDLLRWLLETSRSQGIDSSSAPTPVFDLNERAKSGGNALHLAAAAGHVEVVRYLVRAQRMAPTETDSLGYTPLLLAASQGHLDVVRFLLLEGESSERAEARHGRGNARVRFSSFVSPIHQAERDWTRMCGDKPRCSARRGAATSPSLNGCSERAVESQKPIELGIQ